MSPSLEEAAAELYAVEPGRFTAERTRLTKEARQAKDTEAAKAIGSCVAPPPRPGCSTSWSEVNRGG